MGGSSEGIEVRLNFAPDLKLDPRKARQGSMSSKPASTAQKMAFSAATHLTGNVGKLTTAMDSVANGSGKITVKTSNWPNFLGPMRNAPHYTFCANPMFGGGLGFSMQVQPVGFFCSRGTPHFGTYAGAGIGGGFNASVGVGIDCAIMFGEPSILNGPCWELNASTSIGNVVAGHAGPGAQVSLYFNRMPFTRGCQLIGVGGGPTFGLGAGPGSVVLMYNISSSSAPKRP